MLKIRDRKKAQSVRESRIERQKAGLLFWVVWKRESLSNGCSAISKLLCWSGIQGRSSSGVKKEVTPPSSLALPEKKPPSWGPCHCQVTTCRTGMLMVDFDLGQSFHKRMNWKENDRGNTFSSWVLTVPVIFMFLMISVFMYFPDFLPVLNSYADIICLSAFPFWPPLDISNLISSKEKPHPPYLSRTSLSPFSACCSTEVLVTYCPSYHSVAMIKIPRPKATWRRIGLDLQLYYKGLDVHYGKERMGQKTNGERSHLNHIQEAEREKQK